MAALPSIPAASVIGTTTYGGSTGAGTVFEIVKRLANITTLASFNSANGASPYGGLVLDSSGNLFGTTNSGGVGNYGTVFEIVKNSNSITTSFGLILCQW